jgi:HK97 family phage major capsid protein
MHDAAGYGAEWIPTGFSADLVDRVNLELKVASLFNRITMPQDPFTLPIKSTGATVYKLGESQTEHESATKITKTEVTTTNVTLASTKLGARVNFSEELSEDSIVPILPMLRAELARSMAEGIENTIINGDTTALHQDSDVTASTDVRKSWKGLRKLTNSGGKVSLATFNLENLRSIRTAMGKYGVSPSKLAIVTGISGYIQLLGIKDSSGNVVVTTIDKYGPNATIVTGELAKIDGIPIIVSEHVRENLNASGVYDGTTTTKTILLLVYRDALLIGDRRTFTLKTDEDIETDQTILVATQRLDFQPRLVTTEKFIGLGYNITA